MPKFSVQVLAGALVLSTASAVYADFFTDETTFLSNIGPTFYLEEFANHTFGSPLNGSQFTWDAPGGNGFAWQASALQALYSVPGALSTNVASDPLTITFTGAPVTAFGGNFTGTDINGNIIPSTVTVNLSNGESQTLRDPTASTFLGWTGTVAITSITVNSTETGVNTWPTVDHFYVGTAGGDACLGDLNGSGTVDVDDLIAVILDWGCAGASCVGDADGNNVVNVDDLIAVILNWGAC